MRAARAANAEGEIVAGGIEARTRQVMETLKSVLALAGATFDDVCKRTCWLQDARDFGAFTRIYMSYFPNGRPARSTTEARLMVDAKVEIDFVAYKPKPRVDPDVDPAATVTAPSVEQQHQEPSMSSADRQEVHNPGYDFDDHNVAIGAAYWVLLAERFLKEAAHRLHS